MENLNIDNVACWQQLFDDTELVGPVYVLNERMWRVDMRSNKRQNSIKTSRLGATSLLYQIDIPLDIVESMQLNEYITLNKGEDNE